MRGGWGSDIQKSDIQREVDKERERDRLGLDEYLTVSKHLFICCRLVTLVNKIFEYLCTSNHRRMEVKVVYTNVHENRRAPLCRGMCTTVPNCCKQLGN